jgi:RNA 3'-phosphate cyclase
MLHIDGSYGEGGGQIVRTAVSLSVLTQTPITIDNIRHNRSLPGLRPQHHTALSIMKTLSDAETSGLSVGSSRVMFKPRGFRSGSFSFDIGTAGSMVLVFQTIILGMLQTEETVTIRLRGGSDVKWAPSWDYFTSVFLPVIRGMGVNVSAELLKRGYYPKGGGEALVRIEALKKDLSSIMFPMYHPKKIHGRIHLGNLPDHIAKRMKHSVLQKAVEQDMTVTIQTLRSETDSSGVILTLWSAEEGGMLGSVRLGEKGVSSERVGSDAFELLLSDINCGASVDMFLCDQLLPYVAMARDESLFRVRSISGHVSTNLWTLKHFFPDLRVSFVRDGSCMLVKKKSHK